MEVTNSNRLFVSLHKALWTVLTKIGTRNMIRFIRLLPWYRDTIFYFSPPSTGDEKLLVLTIDDGVSRGGIETSMVEEVVSLLARYRAHATFFVCSDYCTVDEETRQATQDLVQTQGHEIGNHMAQDVSGYYARLPEEEFQVKFEYVNAVIQDAVGTINGQPYPVRWFRAPQGVLTPAMRRVCKTSGVRHVLGDVYCDDWALACRDDTFVYDTLLQQAQEGSIVILHMPEKGTEREAILDVMERFLREMTMQGYKFVSLSEMMEACGDG